MTLVKIYALEDPKETDVISTLGQGEHLLGRGDLLNCNDKRVSRKHAIVTVGNTMVTIKAVHVNPCFFKAADGSNITILPKDTSVILNDGDQFALLADAFWFRVRVILNNSEEYAENVKKELLEDTTKQNEVECTGGGNNTILSPLKVVDVSLNGPVCINNIPSTSKRFNEDNIPEAIYKRQKTSKENEDHEPNISISDENVRSNGESKPTSQSNLESLGTSQNISNTDTTREKNLLDIDSVKLINNLKAIVEEDYGNSRKNPKKQDPQSTGTGDNNLNSSAVIVKEEVLHETIKVKEKKTDVEDEKDKNNEGETANVNNSVKVKEEKPDVDDEKETGETADVNNSNVTVKIEKNVVPVSQDNTNEQGEASRDTIKNDPNDPSCSTDPSTDNQKKKIRRERCWYAPNCYRKNPMHQVDFSHPGDDDYDSDPDDDRPVCPFGALCYRRNIDHRRRFLHINPPAPKPNTDDGKVNKKRRTPKKKPKPNDSEDEQSNDDDNNDNSDNSTTRGKRKAAMKKTYYDSPLDEYDYNDPFIDDASSDEFKLSSEGDDDDDDDTTDWDDSQKVDEQSQETRRLLKEAKRFTKGKGKK